MINHFYPLYVISREKFPWGYSLNQKAGGENIKMVMENGIKIQG
jgi:hypothetical protein